jgi:hypothetical protein
MPVKEFKMMEGQAEIPNALSIRREKPVNFPGDSERDSFNFAHASTGDLAQLRRASVIVKEEHELREDQAGVQQAEAVYKEASLDLFFRIHGEESRNDYNKWLIIKKRKEQDWEQQMYAKYGAEWREKMTEADRELLVYSNQDLEAYMQHKAIEEKAMLVNEKDSNKLQEKEKEDTGGKKINFFKLVKARALGEYQFLGEREVHKAVYSMDFLFFYMKQIARGIVRKGFNQMRGKEVPEYVELERMVNEAVPVVREIAIINKMKPKSTLFSLMQAA